MSVPIVNRCVCHKMTFREWLALRRANGWTIEEATRHTLCGTGCGSCRAYLVACDATGITEIPLLDGTRAVELALRFPHVTIPA